MTDAAVSLPPAHPQRRLLADEVHARPPEPLDTPSRASYVAVLVVRRPTPDGDHVYGNSPLYVFDREKLTFKGELQF